MGALTNKPMAFNSRNWEYNSQLTYDLTDFLSPRIRVDQFNGKIYRILPTVEWISNRIRFLYLGLRKQRINTPITSHLLNFEINLEDRDIFFEKKVLISLNYESAFKLLKGRLQLNKKKNVNLVYGNVFTSPTKVFDIFENKNTFVFKYSDVRSKFNVNKLCDIADSKNILLFGVNPRMESPLFNLKIKEKSFDNIISVGNFSFSYPTKVVSNNTSYYLFNKKGFFENSLLIFGLSTIKFSDLFLSNSKINLLPLYLLNNNLLHTFDKLFNSKLKYEDVNIFLDAQSSIKESKNFSIGISTHFESNEAFEAKLNMPVSGYLESNFKFFNNQLELTKINSLKPNFSLSDLLLAFNLFLRSSCCNSKKGYNINISSNKNKISNVLISNSVPNYLIRDSLGRANPLFNAA